MEITAALVKDLRERTGSGLMECKKALVETAGDVEAAIDLMRKQGLVKAGKKAGRTAADGRIVMQIAAGGSMGGMQVITCARIQRSRARTDAGIRRAVPRALRSSRCDIVHRAY